VVFLVRGAQDGQLYALKRIFVNNSHDLNICQREMHIAVSLLDCNILRGGAFNIFHIPFFQSIKANVSTMTICSEHFHVTRIL
jgi:hypothetical protein